MGKNNKNILKAIVANQEGEIFELEGFAAVGMANSSLVPLTVDQTVNLPFGSEQMLLPDRYPIVFNINTEQFETLTHNPFAPGEPIFPVTAFNSPGYMITYVSAYQERKHARYLPLFSYGAIGWHQGKFRSAVIQVDREKRQDLRHMKQSDILSGVQKMRKQMPDNRLRAHLETCALTYGCPAGKNFFLGRYEAPLPTSIVCNARCLGCISFQENDQIIPTQNRIAFTPSPEEIAEVALLHINQVKHAVVSFGQGCEGEPLMAAHVIEPAIKLIRKKTDRGTINMNTNGSLPDLLCRLLDAGLDSIRISLNSVRKPYYDAYFRPKGFSFSDILKSLALTAYRNKFSSINYLNVPGFTDTPGEIEAFIDFINKYRINHIQWRNLNYDPLRYWKVMSRITHQEQPVGMKKALQEIKDMFPGVTHGYFNPPKEKWLKENNDGSVGRSKSGIRW